MTKRKPRVEKIAQSMARGLSRNQSALMAGYAPETGGVHLSPGTDKSVTERLAEIRAETASNLKITKEEVVQLLMDAANMAKGLEDPTGLVAAAREIGKMLGFYAPELKKITHDLDKNSLRAIMDEMTDDDLIRIANSRAIEGEVKRLPNGS